MLQKRSRRCQSESQVIKGSYLYFLTSPKNTNFVNDAEYLLQEQFRRIFRFV